MSSLIDEVFFPSNAKGTRGRIIQTHELKRDGRVITNINQYRAIREAGCEGGYVLSLAEDWAAVRYARARDLDAVMARDMSVFYKSMIEGGYARWTRTQVHNLRTACPLVVNIARVHPTFDLVLEYENEVVEAPWLPKMSGYIQELDERTGLPRKVGETPVERFNSAYFYVAQGVDVVAAVRDRGPELFLYLDGEPSVGSDRLGVRVAKNFSGSAWRKTAAR